MSLRILAGGIDHPECVAWSANGWLACGGEAGQIYKVDVENATVTEIANTGGFVLGITFDGEDNLYACDMARQAVLRVNTTTGEVEDVTTGRLSEPLVNPNYSVFHPDGRLFFTASGGWGARNGLVYCLEPSGELSVVGRGSAAFTNGLAIDPGCTALYVVESEQPRIGRYPFVDDGLGDYEVLFELPRAVPDGLAFCADGTLLIGCYRPDRVLRWDGDEVTTLVDDWTGEDMAAPTNLAFFGVGLSRLATANLGGWHLTEVLGAPVGAPLVYPAPIRSKREMETSE